MDISPINIYGWTICQPTFLFSETVFYFMPLYKSKNVNNVLYCAVFTGLRTTSLISNSLTFKQEKDALK